MGGRRLGGRDKERGKGFNEGGRQAGGEWSTVETTMRERKGRWIEKYLNVPSDE